jgi:DNA-binding transcriptional MerR regulator
MKIEIARDAGGSPEAGEVSRKQWTSFAGQGGEPRATLEEDAVAVSAYSSIEVLARDFGISVSAIRLYEDRGLLQPRPHENGRAYGPRERLHLKMILKGSELGFALSEIRDILIGCKVETTGRDLDLFELSATELRVVGRGSSGASTHDDTKPDLTLVPPPDQIVARIDHLERQRKILDDAIVALREAHHRRLDRETRAPIRRSEPRR